MLLKQSLRTSPKAHKNRSRQILSVKSRTSQSILISLLGKKSIKWTFTKADRFSKKLPEKGPEYQILKSSLGGRKAGFGYGKRWEPSNSYGKDAPPSTTYDLPLKNKIIGGKISPQRNFGFSSKPSTPGPGSYDLRTCIGNGLSCSFKSRHLALQRDSTPSPGAYNPRHQVVEQSRYKSIAFGEKSKNNDIRRIATPGPGPGAYDYSTSFPEHSPTPTPKIRKEYRKGSL